MTLRISILLGLMLFGDPVLAQSANGHYVSNHGNELIISGNSYTYIGTRGGPDRSRGSLSWDGPNHIRFSGYLHYGCTVHSTVLNCVKGRINWYRR